MRLARVELRRQRNESGHCDNAGDCGLAQFAAEEFAVVHDWSLRCESSVFRVHSHYSKGCAKLSKHRKSLDFRSIPYFGVGFYCQALGIFTT